MKFWLIVLAASLALITEAQAPAQARAATHAQLQGAAIFAQHCANCHDDSKHMVASVGPPLWGLLGRRVGSVPDFAYSPALSTANLARHTWTLKRLNAFMTEPSRVYPGTSMPMAYAHAKDRAALIAYLATLKDRN